MKNKSHDLFFDIMRSGILVYDTPKEKITFVKNISHNIKLLIKDNAYCKISHTLIKFKHALIPYEKEVNVQKNNLLNAISNDLYYIKLENNVLSKLLLFLENGNNLSIDILQNAYDLFFEIYFEHEKRKSFVSHNKLEFEASLYTIKLLSKNNSVFEEKELLELNEKVKELTKS